MERDSSSGGACDPPGVVMLFIAPDGDVAAHASDFDRDGYGGFSLLEAQKLRCRRKLERAIIDAYCSQVIGVAMDEFDRRTIIDAMIKRQGFRMHVIAAGHDEAAG